MRFMMMLKSAENGAAPPREFMEATARLSAQSAKEGKIVAGGSLAPMATSSRVRLSGGKLAVLDGPFTETNSR
jgi:hypothetical protein